MDNKLEQIQATHYEHEACCRKCGKEEVFMSPSPERQRVLKGRGWSSMTNPKAQKRGEFGEPLPVAFTKPWDFCPKCTESLTRRKAVQGRIPRAVSIPLSDEEAKVLAPDLAAQTEKGRDYQRYLAYGMILDAKVLPLSPEQQADYEKLKEVFDPEEGKYDAEWAIDILNKNDHLNLIWHLEKDNIVGHKKDLYDTQIEWRTPFEAIAIATAYELGDES